MNAPYDPATDPRVDAILSAARRPILDIVEVFELLFSDGSWRTVGGAAPHDVAHTGERRSRGFVFRSKDGTRVGATYPTRETAIAAHEEREAKNAENFRGIMLAGGEYEIDRQARYWLRDG